MKRRWRDPAWVPPLLLWRRHRLAAAAIIVVVSAAGLVGCGDGTDGQPAPAADTTAAPANNSAAIGRMHVAVYSGPSPELLLPIVEAGLVGGVVLADSLGNVPDAGTVQQSVRELQAASAWGLIIAVDQEGGPVNHITHEGIRLFPSARCIGSVGDPDLAHEVGWATARQLVALGINTMLGPVADVAADDSLLEERSFGGDADSVSTAVAAWVAGVQEAGVLAVVKHFPGLGRAEVDTHLGPATVEGDREAWVAHDRDPFAAAIESGVAGVMLGHATFPGLGITGPASLDPHAVSILREELGHDGLVATDDLGMGALGDITLGTRSVRAVAAGVDLLLTPPDGLLSHQSLAAAVEAGVIDQERLNDAGRRLNAAIEWLRARGSLEPRTMTEEEERRTEAAFEAAWSVCTMETTDESS